LGTLVWCPELLAAAGRLAPLRWREDASERLATENRGESQWPPASLLAPLLVTLLGVTVSRVAAYKNILIVPHKVQIFTWRLVSWPMLSTAHNLFGCNRDLAPAVKLDYTVVFKHIFNSQFPSLAADLNDLRRQLLSIQHGQLA
jgi:hypothetical protein